MTRPRVSHLTTLVGIAGATATLIALIWLGTLTATGIQRGAAEERLNTNVANEAVEFEHQVQVDLTEVDQTLRILSYAWEADPGHFRLAAWRSHLVLLNEISPDMFIADDHGTVRDATVPALVGSDVSARDYFQSLSQFAFADGGMFISPSTTGALMPDWHMNLARPLRHPDGSFAGVIVAALRIDAMSRFYHAATIGTRGIVAVIGLQQGVVRVAVGPQPIEPGTSVAGTAMLAAMQADPDSVWVGRSPFDGIERVHGFRRVAGRDLVVVVGEDCTEAMRATETWVTAAYVFAGGITLLLVSLAAIIAYAIRGARRREEALRGERAILASANSELAAAKALADDKTMRLGGTLAGMSDGVSMIDGDLRLVEWNPRFPEVACVPADMLHVGLPMADILRAQAEAGVFGAVDVETEVARRVGDLRAGVYETVRERTGPDGRVVELRRNQLPDGGYVTLYSDVTARRESLNALREANALAEAATKAMSRFVAIVSHEIRTPLNVLLTSLGLLADSGMAPTQLVMLAMARQSGDALLALINDILEMSRMEAGRLALRPGRFALRPLIESVIDMFAAQAAERRIALRVSIADGLPDELYEDAGRLRQVLINLLSNAVKFAVPGEVRVIAEPRQAGAGRQVRLAVRDRGPVIDEASRARLFEPFSRLEDVSDAAAVGTGLGLTICRHLVVLMDGEIGCSAWTVGDREAGNEFWLTLPVKLPPGDLRLATPQVDASPPRSLPRTRILLVEDIQASQLVTATLLRRDGHMVDVASSGPEAIDAVASRPYDLVLMDNYMPGMNGLDAARRIRALDGPGAAVPIIALTADVCADDRAAYLAAGMQGILGKPVALRELQRAMGQHVWLHRSEAPQIELAEPIAETMAVSVLSTTRLDELRMALPAARLAQLLEECLVDLGERLMLLQEAVRQQDNGEIVMHTHAMAGMAAEYGLAVLEARLRAVMRGAREAPDAVRALVDGLDFDMARTAAALHELFQIEMA